MKTIIYIVLILFFITNSCAQQKDKIGMVEKFDLIATENGKKRTEKYLNDWFIVISPSYGGYQYEYAPAKDFYMIMKNFHPNGIIKERGKMLGYVKFGIWEYFDENGKLTQAVNEDKKFGKIKPNNVVKIMEEIGIINREKAASILLNRGEKSHKKDGSFYASLTNALYLDFIPDDKEEKRHPVWIINYLFPTEMVTYEIDGNTGKWKRHSNGARIIR